MNIQIFDRTSYPITSRTVTDEGFLRVPGHVARTGVQDYLACELGLDGDPNRIVRVMRPESEVFKQESLDSYNGADATNDHPSDLVNPSTYKATTVGVCVGSGVRDGDFVTCEMIIKDADAIKAIEAGKVQLSAGYTSVYKDAPADADYEFIQTDIKINHVALVDRARAGMQAKLFDKQTQKAKTMIKVSLDSGREVEVEDKAVAALVTDSIDRLKKAVADAEAKASKADAEKDKANDELEEEKKKSSDSAIAAKVAEIVSVTADARKIAGDSFTCDSNDVVEIMRAALKDARPKRDFADKSADYIAAAFDMEKEVEDKDDDEDKEKIAKDAAVDTTVATDAYAKRCADGAASWKKTAGIK